MNRILIVEDEEAISGLIAMSLERVGYTCEAVNDGLAAADRIEQNAYDLVLLDIMLPGLDGWQVCREIRKKSSCPIIMLTAKGYELLEYLRPTGTSVIFITAKGSLGDRVKGLRLGADDYIVKPFEIAELVARVESVLRRTGRGGRMLRAWDVQLDAVARTVTKAGEPVALTPREFDLLEQLIRNRGAALYRDALFERVWGGEMGPDTRTLDLHINRLRKKLGWHDKITTVYKVGYKLEKEEARR